MSQCIPNACTGGFLVSLSWVPVVSNYPDSKDYHRTSISSVLLTANLLPHLTIWSRQDHTSWFLEPKAYYLSILLTETATTFCMLSPCPLPPQVHVCFFHKRRWQERKI